jgi:TetR/AcrR family transcriptional regulator, mexJK operon transcriptional repressor
MARRARVPLGRPKRDDVALLEGKLLRVAMKEFLRLGYSGTSLNKIVRMARVSKTTLYSRFSSKEQLFRAIVHRQAEHLSASPLLRSYAGQPDLEQVLRSYADRALEVSLQGELLGINRLIYSESARFPELEKAAAERTQVGVKHVADFIRERVAAEGVQCRNPQAVAEALIFMIRGWYVDVMVSNRRVSKAVRKQWADRAVDVLLSNFSR